MGCSVYRVWSIGWASFIGKLYNSYRLRVDLLSNWVPTIYREYGRMYVRGMGLGQLNIIAIMRTSTPYYRTPETRVYALL